MLASTARAVPACAQAPTVSATARTARAPSSWATATSGCSRNDRLPLPPLTVTSWPSMVTVTPAPTVMGFFPTRDMARSSSSHQREHFAALAALARRAVGHQALRRRDDGDAEAVAHGWQLVAAAVYAQPRPAAPLDQFDDGLALKVLEADLQVLLALDLALGVAGDVALVLQHAGNAHLELGRRHGDGGLARGLAVADARE